MNDERRRAAATATVGLSGVATAGALRHRALSDAYRGGKRPRLFAERRFIHTRRGRGKYALGATLAAVTAPAAIKGTNDLFTKRQSFVMEGIDGVGDSLTERRRNLGQHPPARLVAGNYATGVGVGSLAGGAVHLGLRRKKLPGGAKSALASTAGVLAGALSLPAQRHHIERATHGRYTATSSGIQRRKVEKKDGELMARAGAAWTAKLSGLADAIEAPKPQKRAGKYVATGRKKVGGTIRELGRDATHLGRSVEPILRHVAKRAKTDPGARLSRNRRRAMVTASGGAPVVGDFAQAAQAARLSPPSMRGRTAVEQYAGNQAGALAGGGAGAAGALALAHHSPTFNRHAQRASDAVDHTKAKARHMAHLPAKTSRRAGRLATSLARTAPGRAVAHNPKVAAIGALAGSMAGGTLSSQLTYSRIMTRDDAYRRANPAASHGSRVAKADTSTGMSRKEELAAIRRKQRSAVINAATSTAGIGSLGMLGVAALPHVRNRAGLVRAATTVGTASAGVGSLNGLESARLQRRDLKAREKVLTSKALGMPRVPGMRRGFLRQTRTATGLKVSSVRGGLIR